MTMMSKLACKIATTVAAVIVAGAGSVAGSENLNLKQPEMKKYEALTQAMPLYPGQVSNSYHSVVIPPGPIAIYDFSADIVEKDPVTGEINAVPLSDAYLHHHVVFSNHEKYYKQPKHWWSPMKPKKATGRGVGFGAGTESRGTVQHFPFPYAFTTVQGEDELLANVHIINTRTIDTVKAHHCFECPCTKEDKDMKFHKTSVYDEMLEKEEKELQSESGSVVSSPGGDLLPVVTERRLDWGECNDQLIHANNTSCSPDSYYGGLLCCEHGEFCIDDYYLTDNEIVTLNSLQEETPDNRTVLKQSTYYLRYSLSYSEVVPENNPLYLASCCDATGDLIKRGNIEYDIPQLCDPTDPNVDPSSDECIHEITTVQYLQEASLKSIYQYGSTNDEEDTEVDVIYLVGHLHKGGMEVTAYNHETNEVICKSVPTYGNGEVDEIGNEPGYINSMSDCSFDPPLRMKKKDKIRLVARYNATQSHTGVMALFYFAIHDVDSSAGYAKGFFKHYHGVAILFAAAILVTAAVQFVNKHIIKRKGYEKVPSSMDI